MAKTLEAQTYCLLVPKTRSPGCRGGDLKVGTESEIVATQDKALETKYHATKILHTETDSKCR
jgi:hypothetical protein